MSDRLQQLSLPLARQAVLQAEAGGLGVVSAYAKLQLARAAAQAGELAEGLTCAIEAAPGLAVAAELADPGQILRWQGDPMGAWHGLGQGSRAAGDRGAYLDGGMFVIARAIYHATQGQGEYLGAETEAFLHRASLVTDRYEWIQDGDRWPVILAVLPRILRGIARLPREPSEVAADDGIADVAIWSALDGAFDGAQSLSTQFDQALSAMMALALGGVRHRPLRQAVGVALFERWCHFMAVHPADFADTAGLRDALEALRPGIFEGDLRSSARFFQGIAAALGVDLSWERVGWLRMPFEGLACRVEQEE